ncbi:MAG: DUF86 domain-containing protein [Chloroflexi bacterium]|nr:DUF86 domain-containing protein [Chloroflexota bacterium]
MVDVSMILERLKRLAEYVEFLERHKKVIYEEFVADKSIEYSVERALQIAIQIVIDIAAHILSTTSNLTANDYADAIVKLAKIDVIPAEFAERIKGMPKFRNVLVHEYVSIDTYFPLPLFEGSHIQGDCSMIFQICFWMGRSSG